MQLTERKPTQPSPTRNNGRLGLLAATLLLAFLLSACSDSDLAIDVPTDYVISTLDQGISYLTEEHPDVRQVTEVVTCFLEIDQTQDYLNPTYSELKGLVSQNFLEKRNDWAVKHLAEHAIRKQLLDCEVTSIIFLGSKHQPTQAIVTVNYRVVYTSATAAYAERIGATIDEPLQQSASLQLDSGASQVVTSTLLPQVDPRGWHITFEQYYVLP